MALSAPTEAGPLGPLGRLEPVELRRVWATEAGSFTPWLAQDDNLNLLAKTIGIDLMIEAQERAVGIFRADIVCKEAASERIVLIENQIERTDHTHLGQLLTYAAGLKAAVIVWIAQKFTDEHRAVLDWLNEITSDQFVFFGVEIELWRIGDSQTAPRFNVVCKPNEWSRAVVKTVPTPRGEPVGIDIERVAYWTEFGETMKECTTSLQPKPQAPRHGWYAFTIDRGRQAYLYAYRDVAQRRIGVYVALFGTSAAQNFEQLSAERSAIDAELGVQARWRPERFRVQLDLEQTNPSDKADWPRQHRWLVQHLLMLSRALADRIYALPLPPTSEPNVDTTV